VGSTSSAHSAQPPPRETLEGTPRESSLPEQGFPTSAYGLVRSLLPRSTPSSVDSVGMRMAV